MMMMVMVVVRMVVMMLMVVVMVMVMQMRNMQPMKIAKEGFFISDSASSPISSPRLMFSPVFLGGVCGSINEKSARPILPHHCAPWK